MIHWVETALWSYYKATFATVLLSYQQMDSSSHFDIFFQKEP